MKRSGFPLIWLALAALISVGFTSCGTTSPSAGPAVAVVKDDGAASTGDPAYKDRAKELVGGKEASGGATTPAASDAAGKDAAGDPSLDGPVLSAAEKKYMETFFSKMRYMVYFAEKPGLDPDIAKAAVAQANRYLVEKEKLEVVDLEQIEKGKADSEKAYEAETGGSIDMIQYIAQKLNADVYLEISLDVQTKLKDGKYSSGAQVAIKLFEASTASLLGSVSYLNTGIVIPGATDAKPSQANAATSAVWAVMPKVVEQAKALMAKSDAMGIKHELVVQKTPDAKLMAAFRKKLSSKVKAVETVSSSASETRYYVYFVGKADSLEDIITSAGEQVPGLEGMYLVFRRGRSFTFNSGL